MNEHEICLCELENAMQNTVLAKHFDSNAFSSCDLFETQLYKEHWHEIQETENTIFNSTLEQLVNSIRP